MSILKYSVVTLILCVPALAQTNATYLLTSSNTVSPATPITTIGIWAAWSGPGAQFVFHGGDYDMAASEGQFSNAVNVLNSPLSSVGMINGNRVTGARNGQIIFIPPIFRNFPSFDNPILLATYDWTTTEFTPRSVDLGTSNTSVFVVIDPFTGFSVDLFPNEFSPGSGVINVVPAPAVWLVLALPIVVGRRRRC